MDSPAEESLLISSLIYRRVVGFLGMALPFLLVVVAGFATRPSISEFYYSGSRDVFIGSMCAVGVFLCCYKGFDIKDWVFCLVAGLAAILLALCPVSSPGAVGLERIRGFFHFGFAAIFLGSLACLSLFQFTQTDPRKKQTVQKVYRNRVYRICGWIMVLSLLLIVVYKGFFDGKPQDPFAPLLPVFSLEAISVFTFGVSWLIKGEMFFGDK